MDPTHALGLRVDLELGLYRGAIRHATRPPDEVFVHALCLVGGLFFAMDLVARRALAHQRQPVASLGRHWHFDTRWLFVWCLAGHQRRHGLGFVLAHRGFAAGPHRGVDQHHGRCRCHGQQETMGGFVAGLFGFGAGGLRFEPVALL